MRRQTLTLRYAALAAVATVANLVIQQAILTLGNTGGVFAAAIGTGTIIGLIVKDLLDKRWIFYDQGTGIKSHGQKFLLYTVMGLVTTAIFLGSETGFWLLWHSDVMREFGAAIGLTLGYVVKYNLDRRFVFTDRQLSLAS